MQIVECSIVDCPKPARNRGLCKSHYYQWLRSDDAIGVRSARRGEPMAFVRAHVSTPHSVDDPCVLWPSWWATLGRKGYGAVSINRRQVGAHRMLLELRDGPPPFSGAEALHGPCHNTACIIHVGWGSVADNAADRLRDGTSTRGERNRNAKVTAADVRAIRASRGVPQAVLAARYGVGQGAISSIVGRRTWGWLD